MISTDRLIDETLRIHDAEERAAEVLAATPRHDAIAFNRARDAAIEACDMRIDHTHLAAPRLAKMLRVAIECLVSEEDNPHIGNARALTEIEKIAKGETDGVE